MITMDTGARSGIMRAKMPSPAADYNEALSHVSHDVLSSLRRVLASYIGAWVSCLGILISAVRGGQARGILIRRSSDTDGGEETHRRYQTNIYRKSSGSVDSDNSTEKLNISVRF